METSYYERLPIYRSAMDLMVRVDNVVRAFPRYHKYGIGARLREESLEIAQLIIQANRKKARNLKITRGESCNEWMKPSIIALSRSHPAASAQVG
ncbi:MAG: four helix bundle protein [Myxococcaceae bacterium]|nr:four helix bundle protein [Myxococcaceae bacterium]